MSYIEHPFAKFLDIFGVACFIIGLIATVTTIILLFSNWNIAIAFFIAVIFFLLAFGAKWLRKHGFYIERS